MTFGKGVASGYPLSGLVTRSEIVEGDRPPFPCKANQVPQNLRGGHGGVN